MDLSTPGWRARFGLIYMHSSVVMEPEFMWMAPQGVSFHTTRIKLPKATTEGLISMAESEELERCTELLSAAPLNVIIFCGTSASFIKGLEWDQHMIDRMQKISGGIPVTTTSRASVNALKKMQIQRISIATPYLKEIDERAKRFFSDTGFVVTDIKGLKISNDHDIGNVPLEDVYRLVKSLDNNCDAVFISCTNLQSVRIIGVLEEELRKPVITAVQASFWECLRLSGLENVSIEGYGTLLNGL